jgi:hypothetical protein
MNLGSSSASDHILHGNQLLVAGTGAAVGDGGSGPAFTIS